MSKLVIDKNNISQSDAHEILRLANIIYFRSKSYEKTRWMGLPAAKCPMDMWIYQELIHALNTDLLIETGTLFGGSALFFANIFDILGRGKVISIDIELKKKLPSHSRIEYIEGSSISPDVLRQVSQNIASAKSVTVILDSDHTAEYKLKELNAYSKYVTKNNYIIAEDSCFDYYPAWPEYGPGPTLAIQNFIKNNNDFTVDRNPELHLITFAPMAFLKKIS